MASQKCFTKGSAALGPVPQGYVRLYSMRFCPFAHRARLVLNAKGIKHEIVNIHLKEKPEWYLKKNPLGQVPTLETPAGEMISDSVIVCEYLDEAFPEKKLFPSSPYCKAQQKMRLESFSKVLMNFYKIPAMRGKGEDVSGPLAEVKATFDSLNQHLVDKKTKFFGGDSITMVDYLMWPWFERLESIQMLNCIDSAPELKKWMDNMLEDPAVKAAMHSLDIHKGYLKSFAEGKVNYDYGL